VASAPCADCGMPDGDHLGWCQLASQQPEGAFRLQRQPSPWSCVPTAFAMVMGVDAAELVRDIGHDDDRGFHPLEVAAWALDHGWAFVCFDSFPMLRDKPCNAEGCRGGKVWMTDTFTGVSFERECVDCRGSGLMDNETFLNVPSVPRLMESRSGVLLCHGEVDHALAWNHLEQKVYNPNFSRHDFDPTRWDVEAFWVGVRC
jgi:hypothetical protein